MVRYSLPLALFALASAALPLRAQNTQTKHVWTTDDMDGLRTRGLISIIGPETEAVATPVPQTAAPAAPIAGGVYSSRFEDPTWYAEQAAELQAQLAARAAALAQARDSLAQARSLRGATGSFNMAAGDTPGITPDDAIATFEAQVRETQTHLDELADLARRNDIPPGVLRAAA